MSMTADDVQPVLHFIFFRLYIGNADGAITSATEVRRAQQRGVGASAVGAAGQGARLVQLETRTREICIKSDTSNVRGRKRPKPTYLPGAAARAAVWAIHKGQHICIRDGDNSGREHDGNLARALWGCVSEEVKQAIIFQFFCFLAHRVDGLRRVAQVAPVAVLDRRDHNLVGGAVGGGRVDCVVAVHSAGALKCGSKPGEGESKRVQMKTKSSTPSSACSAYLAAVDCRVAAEDQGGGVVRVAAAGDAIQPPDAAQRRRGIVGIGARASHLLQRKVGKRDVGRKALRLVRLHMRETKFDLWRECEMERQQATRRKFFLSKTHPTYDPSRCRRCHNAGNRRPRMSSSGCGRTLHAASRQANGNERISNMLSVSVCFRLPRPRPHPPSVQVARRRGLLAFHRLASPQGQRCFSSSTAGLL